MEESILTSSNPKLSVADIITLNAGTPLIQVLWIVDPDD